MHADHCLPNVSDMGAQVGDQVGVVRRIGVAHGVRDVDRAGASLDHRLDDFREEVGLGTRSVLGRELDVVTQGAGVGDRLAGLLDDFVFGLVELVGAVNRAGGQEDMDPATLASGLDRFGSAVDVALQTARQAANAGLGRLAGDRLDGGEVIRRGNRKAGFDDVDAQGFEGAGDLQLLGQVHGSAGRLLAVAQGGVKNQNAVGVGADARGHSHGRLVRRKPACCLVGWRGGAGETAETIPARRDQPGFSPGSPA